MEGLILVFIYSWLTISTCVYEDAKLRGNNTWLWSIVVFTFGIFAIPFYLLVRNTKIIALFIFVSVIFMSCSSTSNSPLSKQYDEKSVSKDIEAIYLYDDASGLILRDNINILSGNLDGKTYKQILRTVMDSMELRQFRNNNK